MCDGNEKEERLLTRRDDFDQKSQEKNLQRRLEKIPQAYL